IPPAQSRSGVQAHGLGRSQARSPGVRQAQDPVTVADVFFDAPVEHPFSYAVRDGMTVTPGQRIAAPLGRAERIGIVVAVRDGDAAGLKPLTRVVDMAPVLDAAGLDLARWIAAQSLSSLGSTLAALMPPAAVSDAEASMNDGWPHRDGRWLRPATAARPPKPELFVGAGRERRLLERLASGNAPALVIVSDLEAAGRW